MTPFLRFPGSRSKAFTMSYDDGSVHDRRLIDIMNKYGLRGTFNICSGVFAETPAASGKLTRSEAYDLYSSSGMDVAVHGARHLSLTAVDHAMATRDIIRDRESLENLFGKIINGMAYANGAHNDKAKKIVKHCGIAWARTISSHESFDLPTDWLRWCPTCHHKNPRLMDLAHQFIERKMPSYFWQQTPSLFFLWGHSHELARDDNWEIIERLGEYIGGRDDVWYATNGEIYNYVSAYHQLVIAVTGKMVQNPTATDVYVNYYGKDVVIPAGKTVHFG